MTLLYVIYLPSVAFGFIFISISSKQKCNEYINYSVKENILYVVSTISKIPAIGKFPPYKRGFVIKQLFVLEIGGLISCYPAERTTTPTG